MVSCLFLEKVVKVTTTGNTVQSVL